MQHGGRQRPPCFFLPNFSLPNFPSMAHLQPISVSCHDILFFLGSKPFQLCLGRAEVQFFCRLKKTVGSMSSRFPFRRPSAQNAPYCGTYLEAFCPNIAWLVAELK